ncbi:MAG: lipocalin family protein [Xanthomonadales bacterium]|jgi:apolipoprotein D and lipocalin family protein|nr:lipocalin family protein [Xanthomonadales bacterium]
MRPVLAALAVALLVLAGCAGSPVRPDSSLPKLGVEDILGRWYIHANVPYFAERGKVGSYVEYIARPDGRFDDLYFFRRESLDAELEQWTGVAEILDPNSNARWRAQFIWPLWTEFRMVHLSADRQWLVVTDRQAELCWIYGRLPVISEERYAELVEVARAERCPVANFVRIPQRPA